LSVNPVSWFLHNVVPAQPCGQSEACSWCCATVWSSGNNCSAVCQVCSTWL